MNNDSGCVKALVIDDEDTIRESFTDYLEDHGFEVLGAENGVIGLELAQHEQPGIILLDLRMPEMDGIEFLKQAGSILPDVPKIVISGANRIGDVVRALRYGAWDYLEKPVKDLSILGHIVDKVIEKARLVRENRTYQEHLETLVRERTQELEQANSHLTRINDRLRQVVKTTQGLSGCITMNHFGPQILEEFSRHMVAAGGSLYLVENGGLRLLHSLDTGHAPDFIAFPLPDNSVLGRVMAGGKPLLIDDIANAADISTSGWTGYRNGSVLAFPLPDNNGETIGVLTLHSRQKPPFVEQDKEIGAILASYSCETFRAVQSFESLKESEQQFRTLFEKSNDAIFIVDKKTGRYLDANHAAAELTGRPIATLKTLSTRDLTPGGAVKRLEAVNQPDTACDLGQVTYIRPDGSERIARLSTVPLNKSKVIGIARDITHDMELQQQLLQAQKMEAIGSLAGGIAHDFNNILSGVFGYTEMARIHVNDPEKCMDNLGQIAKGAQRAADLVQQILTFSRETRPGKKPIRLYLIIKECFKLLRASIPSSIRIHETISSREYVLADITQMHQVIMNLCTNAYHAMGESGGTLTLVLDDMEVSSEDELLAHVPGPGRYTRLGIRDTGCGMDPKTLEKIFNPYFTTKPRGKGTGLGLSLVDGIIKAHQGGLKISSRIGKGTSVQIFLPQVENDRSSPHEPVKKTEPIKGTERILVADDEDMILNIIQSFLEKQGYQVTICRNGQEALTALENNPDAFDLVVTDMTMPEMGGEMLRAEIHRFRPEIPVILCTGFSETMSEEKAAAQGFRTMLMKPTNLSGLATAIRKILDGSENA